MSRAARVILLGMLLALAGVALHVAFDWGQVLSKYPHYLRPLRRVMGSLLWASWYWAIAVPVAMLVVAAWRFARAAAGRAAIAWKLFAFATLWGIGSVAFFFALFLAYVPGAREGGTALLVPGLLGCLGYLVIGVGFILSVSRTD